MSLIARAGNVVYVPRVAAPVDGLYETSFPLSENPLSEGSHWITGLTTGLDWTNPVVNSNGVFCTEDGVSGDNDSIACLTGIWGSSQYAQATVRVTTLPSSDIGEIEILLRFKITAHNARGYEINFSVSHNYCQVVRWNGAFNVFQIIDSRALGGNLTTGDTIKATCVTTLGNSVISVIHNGSVVFTATDDGSFGGTPYTDGTPGLGLFYQEGTADGPVSTYSITHYKASDQAF